MISVFSKLAIDSTDDGETIQAVAGNRAERFSARVAAGPMMVSGLKAPLVIDFAGMAGTDKPIPVVFDGDMTAIVGHTERQTAEGEFLSVRGVMSGASETAREIAQEAAAGFPWQLKLSARPSRAEYIPEGKDGQANGTSYAGPVYIARASKLASLSMTPLCDDDGGDFSLAASWPVDAAGEFEIAEADADTVNAALAYEAKAETQRVIYIGRICHANTPAVQAIKCRAIEEGWTLTQTHNALAVLRDPFAILVNA